MSLKCLVHDVAGIQVRVPILVNHKPISAGDELSWEKITATAFSAMRSVIDINEYKSAAKKRKLVEE